jgi:uncharacterized cupredoxin-like copper-binding protein
MNRGVAVAALLIAAVACGPSKPAASSEETVHVKLRFSRFVPDHFEFAAGTTVMFVVENRDPIDHEFLIGDEETQQAHEEGTEAHHGAKPGEISVPAGKTRTTTYTFDEPGTLLIGCHLPTHYAYGMRGDIEITR